MSDEWRLDVLSEIIARKGKLRHSASGILPICSIRFTHYQKCCVFTSSLVPKSICFPVRVCAARLLCILRVHRKPTNIARLPIFILSTRLTSKIGTKNPFADLIANFHWTVICANKWSSSLYRHITVAPIDFVWIVCECSETIETTPITSCDVRSISVYRQQAC